MDVLSGVTGASQATLRLKSHIGIEIPFTGIDHASGSDEFITWNRGQRGLRSDDELPMYHCIRLDGTFSVDGISHGHNADAPVKEIGNCVGQFL